MRKLFLFSAITFEILMVEPSANSQDGEKKKTSSFKNEIKQEGRDIKKGVKSLGPATKDAAHETKEGVKTAGHETKRVTREMKHDVKNASLKKETK